MGAKATWWWLSRQPVSQARWAMLRSWVAMTTATPLLALFGQDVEEDLGGGAVDAVEGLVEEEQLRLLGQRPGQQHPLALPAGQDAEPVAGPAGQPDPVQGLVGGGPVGPARPADPADAPVTAHQHDLGHGDGELGVERVGLGHVGDAPPGPGRGGAEDLDGAGHGVDEAEDRLDQRALAGAVGPDEGQRPAGCHLAGDPGQHRAAAVGDAEGVEPQGRGGWRSAEVVNDLPRVVPQHLEVGVAGAPGRAEGVAVEGVVAGHHRDAGVAADGLGRLRGQRALGEHGLHARRP